ncbi:MAG: hypothetical protein GY820_36695 [Gammaproteobacteria bacterium]|nr:hypothetical protein [Gammaproteobacteria bacterium]
MEAGNWTRWEVETAAPQPLSKVKEDSNGKSIMHYDGKRKQTKHTTTHYLQWQTVSMNPCCQKLQQQMK